MPDREHCLYCGTAKKDCFPESLCCPYCDHEHKGKK